VRVTKLSTAPVQQPASFVRRLLVRRWWLDAVAATGIAVLSTTIAYRHVYTHFALSYDAAYRDATEDLLYPCVGRLGWTIDAAALDASREWQAFAAARTASLDCGALQPLPRVNAGHLSEMQRYLHASFGAMFWLNGPRRSVYAGYMSVMFALTVLASYGLFRLAVRPLVASVATLPFMFSSLHLNAALHPAEYVKAPFILGCLFLVGAIVLGRSGRRGAIALSLGAGAVVGLGIGFRTDVIICVPVALGAIAAFAPSGIGVRWRAAAAAAFLCSVVLAGWPVLKAQFLSGYGSLFPVQVLGGMAAVFADYYAQPPLYDYGVRFDDTHVTYLVNSYDQRVLGSTRFVDFYSTQLQNAATRLVVDIDRMFPGDFLLRSFAGIVNVLKYARFGLPAAVLVVSVLLVTDRRLGACLVFLLCTAVGYVSLVFQAKHFFHLEWVPWWFIAVAVEQAAVRLSEFAGSGSTEYWLRAHAYRLAALPAMAVAVLAAFFLVRHVQQSQVTAHIAALLRQAGDRPLATATRAGDDGATRLIVDGLGAAPHPTALVEDYLALDVECGAPQDATITGVYDQATSPRERMTVPCSNAARHWTLFWPIYQRPPDSRFRWFETSGAAPIRIQSVHRIADLGGIRLLLKLAVPDDYSRRRWFQELRPRFFRDPLIVR
jgi:hypothetical protein